MGFKETMLNFAEKVSDTVNEGFNKSKESYNKMTEKNRIKKEISTLTSDIESAFASIGKKIYEEERENEKYKDIFDEVVSKQSEIESLQKQLNALEGSAPCPSCGELVQNEAAFCPKCGASTASEATKAEVEVVEAEEVAFCSQCGAKLNGDSKFCNQCGNKIAD